MAHSAHHRYADIFRDIEALIVDHSMFYNRWTVAQALNSSRKETGYTKKE